MRSLPNGPTKLALSIACAVALCIGFGAGPAAAGESAKRRDVRKLLKLSGADKIGAQVMTQLMASFRRSFPQVPGSYWNKLRRRMKTNELINEIVPVYERHFTRKDIQGLIAFYQSPVGRKFVSVQPKLVAESMQIGQRWGQKVAQKVMREIRAMKK